MLESLDPWRGGPIELGESRGVTRSLSREGGGVHLDRDGFQTFSICIGLQELVY